MFVYLLALFPLYIFVYSPLTRAINGGLPDSQDQAISFNESLFALDEPLACPTYPYNVQVFSHEPLVLYLSSFVSDEEASHLISIR